MKTRPFVLELEGRQGIESLEEQVHEFSKQHRIRGMEVSSESGEKAYLMLALHYDAREAMPYEVKLITRKACEGEEFAEEISRFQSQREVFFPNTGIVKAGDSVMLLYVSLYQKGMTREERLKRLPKELTRRLYIH